MLDCRIRQTTIADARYIFSMPAIHLATICLYIYRYVTYVPLSFQHTLRVTLSKPVVLVQKNVQKKMPQTTLAQRSLSVTIYSSQAALHPLHNFSFPGVEEDTKRAVGTDYCLVRETVMCGNRDFINHGVSSNVVASRHLLCHPPLIYLFGTGEGEGKTKWFS